MRGKIPKSELLVTFEVVARHESYTRAAEELALTQSAVFRQVTALEEFLHTSLFNAVITGLPRGRQYGRSRRSQSQRSSRDERRHAHRLSLRPRHKAPE